jgi:SAM-dependent methyltransferase
MEPSEYYNIARLEDIHWWYVGMTAIVTRWMRRLPLRPAGEPQAVRALDAGCGTGGGLKLLAGFGRPAGVDVHPLALQLALEKGYTAVAGADVQHLPFAAGTFGLVISYDVLCHLRVSDDTQALRDFARVLAPDGWVMVRLPAHEWIRRSHDRAVHTRHRYTRHELQAKLEEAGLRAVRVTYANALLMPVVVLWRLVQGRDTETGSSDVRLPPRPINAILTALLRLEGWWLSRFDLPIGLSVLALARKDS